MSSVAECQDKLADEELLAEPSEGSEGSSDAGRRSMTEYGAFPTPAPLKFSGRTETGHEGVDDLVTTISYVTVVEKTVVFATPTAIAQSIAVTRYSPWLDQKPGHPCSVCYCLHSRIDGVRMDNIHGKTAKIFQDQAFCQEASNEAGEPFKCYTPVFITTDWLCQRQKSRLPEFCHQQSSSSSSSPPDRATKSTRQKGRNDSLDPRGKSRSTSPSPFKPLPRE
ncbi:hypothetical protein KEM48_007387 [Puccinia striiformis f. sp. tritici PST-130]|nr:hypothetical protein KEM48_007387 [Puccinia striiformis f. sp. tritici PST-130]